MPAGTEYALKRVRNAMSFRVGERVSFTPQQFAHVMMTLHAFGQELIQGVIQAGKAAGIPDTSDTKKKNETSDA